MIPNHHEIPLIPYQPQKCIYFRNRIFQPFQYGPDNYGIQRIDQDDHTTLFVYRNYDDEIECIDQMATEIEMHTGNLPFFIYP